MKILCWIFGHNFFFPSDEKYKELLGGICRRCLKLTELELNKTCGSTIVFNRLKKTEEKVKL